MPKPYFPLCELIEVPPLRESERNTGKIEKLNEIDSRKDELTLMHK